MWTCQNCETLNDGEFCIICGEAKSKSEELLKKVREEDVSSTDDLSEEISVKIPPTAVLGNDSKKTKTIIGVLLGIVAVIAIAFGIIHTMYSNSCELISNGEYMAARNTLSKITYYKDANELLIECDYREAKELLENNEAQAAKTMFENISYYKDSSELIKECDYKSALWQMSNGELMEAYDKFSELADYSDSASQLSATKQLIYQKGIELYQADSYSDAETYFKKSQDCGRESDYLRLIEAHTTTISDVSTLYDLVGFEDTVELLGTEKYFEKYLRDDWTNSSGYYIKFKKNTDSSYNCSWNLPWTEGKYYKLENGVHYHGSDESGWTKQWSYTIVGANVIKVYCYKDGRTYTLYRN